jgi:acyl-CoA synthetase (AMP-forming)/AMP-acid ligase II
LNIWNTLEEALTRSADRTAVVDGVKRLTWQEVHSRICALALLLQSKGIERGDRVAILDDNSIPYLEAYYAAAGLGAIVVPLNIRLAPVEIAFILKDSGARLIIAGEQYSEVVEQALKGPTSIEEVVWTTNPLPPDEGDFHPEPVQEGDVAHLYYTSGTTGRPKGVMLTHRNVCLHAKAAIEELGITPGDVWGHIAPMFHLADAWATFAITWTGGRHVMVDRFEPEAVLAAIEKHSITLSNLIPTMLNLMVKHPRISDYDLSSLRVILSGGAPIAPDLVGRIIETFGCDYIQTYGMTETSPYLTLSILADHLKELPAEKQIEYKARTGRPFKAVELKVVDENGKDVRADDEQVGEIRVRGETVTPGYWNLPEETDRAFKDGWLCTGDLAVIDSEGYVNIVDRKKDMIITGGENVYSIEVENVLYMNPKVLEAAVFGVPDEKWGEVVRAAVVLKPGKTATSDEIIDSCRDRIAAFKLPRKVEFLDELPRTGSGKISKKLLRERG